MNFSMFFAAFGFIYRKILLKRWFWYLRLSQEPNAELKIRPTDIWVRLIWSNCIDKIKDYWKSIIIKHFRIWYGCTALSFIDLYNPFCDHEKTLQCTIPRIQDRDSNKHWNVMIDNHFTSGVFLIWSRRILEC